MSDWLLQAAMASTAVLGAGAIAITCCRTPIARQRWGELTILAFLAWAVLAVVPLPRVDRDWIRAESAPAPVRPEVEDSVASPAPVTTTPATRFERPPMASERTMVLPPAVPSLPSRSPSSQSPSFATLAVFAYGIGSAVATLYLLIGVLWLRRTVRRARPAAPWMIALAADVVSGRVPRLLVTSRSVRPLCFGVRRPTIVLPASLTARARAADAREVLLHELAHVSQRDGRGQLLFALALPLLYAHPLYWWVRRRARLGAEMVADDWAAVRSTKSRYARALVALAASGLPRAALNPIPSSMFRSRSEFYWRMKMLLERTSPLHHACSRRLRFTQIVAFGALVAVVVALFGTTTASAQENAEARARKLEAEVASLRAQVDDLASALADARRALDAVHKTRTAPGLMPQIALPRGAVAPDPELARTDIRLSFKPVIVRPGDTLQKIVKRNGGGARELGALRRIQPRLDPEKLRPGQIVLVPFVARSADRLRTQPATSAGPILDDATLRLVDRLMDAQNARRRAAARMELAKRGVAPEGESRADLEGAERKYRFLRSALEEEIAAGSEMIDALKPSPERWRLERRVRLLKKALD